MATSIQHSVTISRQISEVFRYVADFSNHSQWQASGVHMERAGQVRVGDMVVGTRRLGGRMVQVNADVVELVPNQKLAISGVMGGFPFRTTYSFKFVAGGSEVTENTEIRVMWWYFFLRPFVIGSLRSQIRTGLENLKQLLDRS
jgi:uncharacterized protein YndB with AHSA1/START domain